MKGLTKRWLLLLAAVCATTSAAFADDLYMTWECILDGSLAAGSYAEFSGSTVLGGDTIHDVFGDFFFPNAVVGNGTGTPTGTVTVTCTVTAPEGVYVEDVTIYLLGQIVPGLHATAPWLAWTELILDITDPDHPETLVSDSGVEYSQPTSMYYAFRPTRFLRIKETFTLDGVTYVNDLGQDVIDDTAMVALTHIQKDVSLVPEPAGLATLSIGLLAILGFARRRK
jgi:hypothetical protein